MSSIFRRLFPLGLMRTALIGTWLQPGDCGRGEDSSRFNGFATAEKRLKPLKFSLLLRTGLKPGANETGYAPTLLFPQRLLVLGLTTLALFSPWLAGAQNTLRWTTNFYLVTGATLGEIRQSLNQSRSWRTNSSLEGLTEWRIDWRFSVSPTAGGCRCSSFTTSTTISITLPRWTSPTNAALFVKEAWSRYIAALGQHEAGHAQMALAAVAEQHKRVKEIGEVAECDGLKMQIDSIARRVVEDFRKRDEEYDRRTEHGAKQGAFLPGRHENRGRRRE